MGEKGLRTGNIEDLSWRDLKWDSSGHDKGWERDSSDHARAFNPATGQNAAWDPDRGQWIDTKTGQGLTRPVYK